MTTLDFSANHKPTEKAICDSKQDVRSSEKADTFRDVAVIGFSELASVLTAASALVDETDPEQLDLLNLIEVARKRAIRTIEDIKECEAASDGWEHAGWLSVKTGTIMVGDPGFIVDEEHPAQRDFGAFIAQVDDAMEDAEVAELTFASGYRGLGVIVACDTANAPHPVAIRRDDEGHVAEVKITILR